MSEEARGGISRRDLIRRGAVVGGVVWAAPVVQSLAAPASAAEGSPSGGECTNYFRFKFNWNGTTFVPDGGTSLPGGDDCAIQGFADYPLGNDKVLLIGMNLDRRGNPRTVKVEDKPGDNQDCVVVLLEVKAGSKASVGADMVCASDVDGDGTVSTATGKAISYVAGIICCE